MYLLRHVTICKLFKARSKITDSQLSLPHERQ